MEGRSGMEIAATLVAEQEADRGIPVEAQEDARTVAGAISRRLQNPLIDTGRIGTRADLIEAIASAIDKAHEDPTLIMGCTD